MARELMLTYYGSEIEVFSNGQVWKVHGALFDASVGTAVNPSPLGADEHFEDDGEAGLKRVECVWCPPVVRRFQDQGRTEGVAVLSSRVGELDIGFANKVRGVEDLGLEKCKEKALLQNWERHGPATPSEDGNRDRRWGHTLAERLLGERR